MALQSGSSPPVWDWTDWMLKQKTRRTPAKTRIFIFRFFFENQDKMTIEKLLEGNCVSPLSSVPYKGKFSGVISLFKIVYLFYGGNEHQIGVPG